MHMPFNIYIISGRARQSHMLYHDILARAIGLWVDGVYFKATFVSIFAPLRPHNLVKLDSTEHLVTHKKVHQQQREYRYTPDDVDCLGREGLADRKCSRDQGSVGKYKREPGHRKDHLARSKGRKVGGTGNNKPKHSQAGSISICVSLWAGRLTPTTIEQQS